jgi:hypothetical protein
LRRNRVGFPPFPSACCFERPKRNESPSKKKLVWYSRVATEFTPGELATVARIGTVEARFTGDPGRVVVAAVF